MAAVKACILTLSFISILCSVGRRALAIHVANGSGKGVQHVEQCDAVNKQVQHVHVTHCRGDRAVQDLPHTMLGPSELG